ncbi:hypothetical protein AAC387_Pa12g0865 [Persea americana]
MAFAFSASASILTSEEAEGLNSSVSAAILTSEAAEGVEESIEKEEAGARVSDILVSEEEEGVECRVSDILVSEEGIEEEETTVSVSAILVSVEAEGMESRVSAISISEGEGEEDAIEREEEEELRNCRAGVERTRASEKWECRSDSDSYSCALYTTHLTIHLRFDLNHIYATASFLFFSPLLSTPLLSSVGPTYFEITGPIEWPWPTLNPIIQWDRSDPFRLD